MNTQRTNGNSVTERLPVRYELTDKDGKHVGWFRLPATAALWGERLFPGGGYDIEMVRKEVVSF